MQTTRERVLAIKKADPDASMQDIADRVHVSRVRVWQILAAAGLIVPGENRRYIAKPKADAAPRPEIRPHAMPWCTPARLMAGRA